MSGVDLDGRRLRKGATDAIGKFVAEQRRERARPISRRSPTASRATGGTPLAVADGARLLGVIHLKDIVKGGMKERIAQLRAHGHPHRHDHRRQPAHRRRHCRRSRRGRFPGPGHAQGQARVHQERTGGRAGWSP